MTPVSMEDRQKALKEFSALARQVGAEAAAAQRPDLYNVMQGKPAPAPVLQFKGKGATNRDRQRKPSPWARWIVDADAWLHVPPSPEELDELAAGIVGSDEMTLDEARRRLNDGDEAA